MITKKQILNQIEKFKIEEIPENLVEQEMKILSQGLKEEDLKSKKKEFETKAKQRIKVGLILNEYGEQNKIEVEENEMQAEVQKQLRMMPGQEKMVMDFYQKNKSALASLRGTVYEEKIISAIKEKAKGSLKEVTKDEAEKILKESQKTESDVLNEKKNSNNKKVEAKKSPTKKTSVKSAKSKPKTKKVSKK